MRFWVSLLFYWSLIVVAKDAPAPYNGGVILLYHHVSTETPASTSVSPEQFAKHMAYLAQNHTVVPLKQLVDSVRDGTRLPENAVAITFDDGYQNIADNAHPILLSHGFPYTIFINPALIGVQPQQLSWQRINQMRQEGVSFANHSSTHKHLLTGSTEQPEQWLAHTLADIEQAEQRLSKETGESLKYLAYPYGEFNLMLKSKIQQNGYVGFGQQSGAVASYSDFGALPRVPAAGIYANLETLKVKLAALAMPVIRAEIEEPQRNHHNRRPQQSLWIETDDFNTSLFTCFFNSEPIPTQWQDNKVVLTLEENLPVGRSRINCTVPSIKHAGRYYWYSQPWFVPTANLRWPD
jgi:peptidoglycan/xylan/chitin deacetylase (PgdA/CDA1 family)